TGSLRLDLATAVEVTLLSTQPQKIPTGIYGPLIINKQVFGALLIGRSSASLAGLFVLPGLIDADYTGQIMVMAYTIFPPLRIPKGQRIAQLIPLPQLTKPLTNDRQLMQCGDRGFGSTKGLTLLTLDLSEQPKHKVTIIWKDQTKTLDALLDTGADSSIIA
ncbi:hypothetical protein N305_04484, partial [Manacus vitellinus]